MLIWRNIAKVAEGRAIIEGSHRSLTLFVVPIDAGFDYDAHEVETAEGVRCKTGASKLEHGRGVVAGY